MFTPEQVEAIERIHGVMCKHNEILGIRPPADSVDYMLSAAVLFAKSMEEGGLAKVALRLGQAKRPGDVTARSMDRLGQRLGLSEGEGVERAKTLGE